jgi:hypothetical protein
MLAGIRNCYDVIILGELSMRTVISAAIAAMFAFAPVAYAAGDMPMATTTVTTTTFTKEQCDDEKTKCGDDAVCKQDLETAHPECKDM